MLCQCRRSGNVTRTRRKMSCRNLRARRVAEVNGNQRGLKAGAFRCERHFVAWAVQVNAPFTGGSVENARSTLAVSIGWLK